MNDLIARGAAFLRENSTWIIVAVVVPAILWFRQVRMNKGNYFQLYSLSITDIETGKWFNIGFFESEALAGETAKRYLAEVTGFKDHPCEYNVSRMAVHTYKGREGNKIYVYIGWNEYNGKESDVWMSCYFTRVQYKNELMKWIIREIKRENWTVSEFEIGKAYWEEGFVRT